MIVARYMSLSIVIVYLTCVLAMAEEPEVKAIRAVEIEEGATQILGKSDLPLGTSFSGKLTIVDVPGKDTEVKITIPSLGRTISYDMDLVGCFALNSTDQNIRAYNGEDIVAYEYISYYGYPVDFWEDKAPLVSPSRKRSTGMYNMIMVRRAKLMPSGPFPE